MLICAARRSRRTCCATSPRIGPEHISIRQIDSHEHILSAFDRTIAMYATEHFRRSGIDLILSCRVRTPPTLPA